ncbi:esterase/lipase family protein [Ilumatobacter sp.]|uniref:esterase/lipase family protein n=1 Tax=Ilumatobacter sp. TaxID=1967498 RepID=UPI003C33BA4C
MSDNISAPSPLLAAMEVRAVYERAQMSALLPALRRLPKGDGHPVLVLPGFSASDRSTAPLRDLLKRLGYRTYGWGLGVNVGPTSRILEGLVDRLDRAHQRRGEPVSIVGWSLGGIYGRELARARPTEVRQVITLGSPIQMIAADSSTAQPMFETLRKYHSPEFDRPTRESGRPLLPVPSTSIYTQTDGVVSWQACLVRRAPTSENVRVFGSHCGLGFNAAAITVIADRLAQPAGTWKPFSAPWYLRGAFPPSTDLDTSRGPHFAVA